jgi:hypothetical protein
MEPLEVLITLPLQSSTVPAGATTGTVSVQQLLILLQNNETFTLSLERLRLLEQSMIMMRLNCSTITPASATEGSPAVFEFSLSNPSAVDTTLPHSPMELLEVLITPFANSNRTCGCYYGNRKCTNNC